MRYAIGTLVYHAGSDTPAVIVEHECIEKDREIIPTGKLKVSTEFGVYFSVYKHEIKIKE